MRVHCPVCGHVCIISSRSEISNTLAKLYCICGNPLCGHSFVSTLAFSHTLSPSAYDLPEKVRDKLAQTTSRKQVQLLFEGMA